jgi:hypothetical protein
MMMVICTVGACHDCDDDKVPGEEVPSGEGERIANTYHTSESQRDGHGPRGSS